MEERQTDRIVEAIGELTRAITELSVKVKRLTNSPITQEKYDYIVNRKRSQ